MAVSPAGSRMFSSIQVLSFNFFGGASAARAASPWKAADLRDKRPIHHPLNHAGNASASARSLGEPFSVARMARRLLL
jgi:hypothetical protein